MKVSVIIAAYNADQCIGRAIASALSQTLRPHEILVVDDGSTDSTVELIETLANNDPSIRLVRQAENGGPAAARNTGIEHATGDWIAILDADDMFLPNRLSYLVEAAKRRNFDFVADNCRFFDHGAQAETGIAIDPKLLGEVLELDRYSFVRHCRTSRRGRADFGLLKPLIRRSFLESTGVRYSQQIRHGEDFVFYLHALLAGARFGVMPGAHYLYTERHGTISQSTSMWSRTFSNIQRVEEDTRAMAEQALASGDRRLSALLIERADALRDAPALVRIRDMVRNRDILGMVRAAVIDSALRRVLFKALLAASVVRH
jgi:succinoglycan biosynthesis protein ExoO